MIEIRDDLDRLMFDIQLAYAFQDVEKNHNPMKTKTMFIQTNQCVIRYKYNISSSFIIRIVNDLLLIIISHSFQFTSFDENGISTPMEPDNVV
jgi:hypothetical protein